MTHTRRTSAVATCLLIVSLGGAVATVRGLDRLRPLAGSDDVLYVPSPKALRTMSLGYTGLLADIYWTRAVQYFGWRHKAGATTYPLLAPLLEITTELDPHLLVAYQFGGTFLAQQPPEGAGEPQKAVELVRHGIRENPDDWHLYYQLGFIQAMELHDYLAAAQTFLRGSEIPGAHAWMRVLAANMAQHGGETQTARFLWSRVYDNTEDPMIRANALRHLRALQVDDDVQRLQALARGFAQRTGRPPQSFDELVAGGWLRRVPLDPLGHPYRLVGGQVYVQDAQALPFIQYGKPAGQ